jgi:DNA-binding transcriptional ArsR family regulator
MKSSASDTCQNRTVHQDRIDRARERSLARGEREKMAQTFKVMGDPTRLSILWALEKEEMCVCDLAAFVGISESAISHQLRVLRQLNLVANRREGTVLYYRLDDHHVRDLFNTALDHIRE